MYILYKDKTYLCMGRKKKKKKEKYKTTEEKHNK